MPWQVVMLFQNALAAIFAVNSRQLAKKFQRATIPFNVLIYLTTALSGIVYALFHGLHTVSAAGFEHYFGFFCLGGLSFAVTNILSYVVFQYVDAAVASLLSTLNIIAAIIFSTVVLHEGLHWQQIIGAIVLLAGMEIILTINMSHHKHKQLGIAITLSVLASIFFAVATTNEKYLLNHVNLSTYLTFGWGFQFLGVLVVALIFSKYIKANLKLLTQARFYRIALPASFIRVMSGLLFIFSLKLSNNLSVISALSGLKVILAALLAAYILKERDYLGRKIEAAIAAATGIALIYWK